MLRKFGIMVFRAGEKIKRGDLVEVNSENGLLYKTKGQLSREEFEKRYPHETTRIENE